MVPLARLARRRAHRAMNHGVDGNPAYIPVAVNFAIFLLNDLYGFISWKKRKVLQTA